MRNLFNIRIVKKENAKRAMFFLLALIMVLSELQGLNVKVSAASIPDAYIFKAGVDQSGQNWTWDGTTKTMTLDGATFDKGLWFKCDATIILNPGTQNTIRPSKFAKYTNYAYYGILCRSEAPSNTNNLQHVGNYDLSIYGDGHLDIVPLNTTVTYSYGISAKVLTVANASSNPVINITLDTSGARSYCLYAGKIVVNNGQFFMNPGMSTGADNSGASYSMAMYANQDGLFINGGYIKAVAKDAGLGSYGLRSAGGLTINDGIFEITTGRGGAVKGSLGIYATKQIVINGGMIKVMGDNTYPDKVKAVISKDEAITMDVSTLDIINGNPSKATFVSGTTNEISQVDYSVPFKIGQALYSVELKNATGGSAIASKQTGLNAEEITLTAYPDALHHFKEWQVLKGGITVSANKFNIGSDDIVIQPVFESHSYSYSVKGGTTDTLLASCACGEEEELTVSATSGDYTGAQHGIDSWNATQKAAWESVGLTLPTVTYYTDSDCAAEHMTTSAVNASSTAGGVPVNAGTYWAVVTQGTASVTVSYSINKVGCQVTNTPAAATLVYNGTAQNLLSTVPTPSFGTVKYAVTSAAVTLADSEYVSDTAQAVNAGTYYVYYKIVGDANHSDYTVASPIAVTVAKSTPGAPTSVSGVAPSSGAAIDGQITGMDATMEYSVYDGVSWSGYTAVTSAAITGFAAGTQVNVRYAETSNTNASSDTMITIPTPGPGGDPTGTPGPGGDPTGTPGPGGDPTGTPGPGGDPTGTPGPGGDPTGTPGSGGDPTGTPGPGGDPTGTPGPGGDPTGTPGPSGDPTGTPGPGGDPTGTPGPDGDGENNNDTDNDNEDNNPEPVPTPDLGEGPGTPYTVPFESADNSIPVEAEIKGTIAEVKTIDDKVIEDILNKETDDKVILDVSGTDEKVIGVALDVETAEKISEVIQDNKNEIETLEIELPGGSVSVNGKALDAIAKAGNSPRDLIFLVVEEAGNIADRLTAEQKKAVEDTEIIAKLEAYVLVGNKQVHDLEGGTLTVVIDYPFTAEINAAGVDLVHMMTNGHAEHLAWRKTSRDGKICAEFDTTSLSYFTFTYNPDRIVDASKYEIAESIVDENSILLNKDLVADFVGNTINVSWGMVEDADGYRVYATYCGTKYGKAVKKVKSADVCSVTLTELKGEPIDSSRPVKLYVKAYKIIGGKVVYCGKTIRIHIVSDENEKFTNVSEVTVKREKVNLKNGNTSKIKGSVIAEEESKELLKEKHAPKLRYRTSDAAVAEVSAEGEITAVGEGTCLIYTIAINGVYKTVGVNVK